MALIVHNRLLRKPWRPDDRTALVLPAAPPVPRRPMAGPENAGGHPVRRTWARTAQGRGTGTRYIREA